MAFTVSWRT